MTKHKLRIIPLGGLGEVGKNMMVYEWGEQIIVVDTGMMFPENDMLGIDYIIPDFQYLLEKKERVCGIFITHGHEDHTGAIHHVLEQIKAPIYATPLTVGLLENKLSRGGLINKVQLNTVQAGDSVQAGPFTIEFFHVCHSIPDGVGLGIFTPVGLVIHSGDYKFDHTPVDNWPTDYAQPGRIPGQRCPGPACRFNQCDSQRVDAFGTRARQWFPGSVSNRARAHYHRQLCLADFTDAAGRKCRL